MVYATSLRTTQAVTRRSSLSKCHAFLWYGYICHLIQANKVDLSCTDLVEIHKRSTALRADLLYKVSPNQTIDVGSMVTNQFTSPPPQVKLASTVTTIVKLTVTQYISVDICCPKFYPNRTQNVDSTGKISFTPLSTAWLSLHRFSRNSQLPGLLFGDLPS